MTELTTCDTKQFFDTEWEAIIYAAKATAKYGDEFEAYQCGTHWHLTHTQLCMRRGTGKNYWRCPKCKQIKKSSKAHTHKCP